MLFSGILERFSEVYVRALNGPDAGTIIRHSGIQMVFSFSPVLFQRSSKRNIIYMAAEHQLIKYICIFLSHVQHLFVSNGRGLLKLNRE
jgi:hypothetical protein